MATKKPKQTKAAPIKTERLVYLGPNLIRYGLTKYAVYKGGLPLQQAAKAFEKWPLLKLLFASPSKLAETEQAMQKQGTPQHEALQQIMKRGEE